MIHIRLNPRTQDYQQLCVKLYFFNKSFFLLIIKICYIVFNSKIKSGGTNMYKRQAQVPVNKRHITRNLKRTVNPKIHNFFAYL